tara:strand:- start:2176 stop:3336 length:1161 start_codon:yes stop_codon:yes gene_type:complete
MNRKIEKIIIKYFARSASIDELEALSKWMKDPINVDCFREFSEINYLADYSLIDFDSENEKQKTLKMIRQKRLIKINPLGIFRYAAGIILIIGLGYLIKDHKFKTLTNDIPKTVNTIIEPGSNKATLTLEDGSLLMLANDQKLKTQNADSNGEVITYNSPKKKSDKIQYNYLTTPRGGQYSLVLSDKTEVWLNSESQLKYPVAFIEGETREVELIYGEAYFDVFKISDNQASRFKVLNKSQVIEVLGTEFNLKAYKDEDYTYTTLVEGKVDINLKNGDKKQLFPEQQAKWNPSINSFSLKTDVNINNEISWRYGIFNFDGKPLVEIMKTISRWYDIDVLFLNKEIEETEFVGVIRKNRNLEDILINIKNFGVIKDYEINKKTVILK